MSVPLNEIFHSEGESATVGNNTFFTEQEHQKRVEEFGSKLLKSMHCALQKHAAVLAKLQSAFANAAAEKMSSASPTCGVSLTSIHQQQHPVQGSEVPSSSQVVQGVGDGVASSTSPGIKKRQMLSSGSTLPGGGKTKFYGEDENGDDDGDQHHHQQKKDEFEISTMYPALKNKRQISFPSPPSQVGREHSPSTHRLQRTFSETKLQSQLEALVGSDAPSSPKETVEKRKRINPMASFLERQEKESLQLLQHQQQQQQQQQRQPKPESCGQETVSEQQIQQQQRQENTTTSLLSEMSHADANKTKNFFELPSTKNLRELRVLAYALREATTKLSSCVNRDKQSSFARVRLASNQQANVVDDMLLVSSARNVLSHLEGNILSFVQKRRRARLLATTMPQNLLDQLAGLMKSTGILKQQQQQPPQVSPHNSSPETKSSVNGVAGAGADASSSTSIASCVVVKTVQEEQDKKTLPLSSPSPSSSSSSPTTERIAFVMGDQSSSAPSDTLTTWPFGSTALTTTTTTTTAATKSALKTNRTGIGERRKSRVGFDDNIRVVLHHNLNNERDPLSSSNYSTTNNNSNNNRDDGDDDFDRTKEHRETSSSASYAYSSTSLRESSDETLDFFSSPTRGGDTTKSVLANFEGLKASSSADDAELMTNFDFVNDESAAASSAQVPLVGGSPRRRQTLRSELQQDHHATTTTSDETSGNNSSRRISTDEILAAARSQLAQSQKVVDDKGDRDKQEKDDKHKQQQDRPGRTLGVNDDDEEMRKFLGVGEFKEVEIAGTGDPMFIDVRVPPPTPVGYFEQQHQAKRKKKEQSLASQNPVGERKQSAFLSPTVNSEQRQGEKKHSFFLSNSKTRNNNSRDSNTAPSPSPVKHRLQKQPAKLHEVRMLVDVDDGDNDGNNDENDSSSTNSQNQQRQQLQPQLISEDDAAMVEKALGVDSMWRKDSVDDLKKSLKRQPSAIMQYGSSDRDQDLTVINKTGRSLATLLDRAKNELTSSFDSAMNPRDATLLRQLVKESENLLGEMEPISHLLGEEQQKRRNFVNAIRQVATEEYNELMAKLLERQHEALRLKEQRRALIRQYLIWRQTKRADAAMTAATFKEHLSTGLSKRSVGTQCSVPASALPVQLVKTVRMMQEVPNLQRHMNEIRKLVVELSSVDAKSEEAMGCQVCSGSLHDAILIWPCGDTVCKRCAREAVKEYADQPFKMCPACKMISMTESFNVSPNLIVSDIAAKWSFKKSGFYDVASASEALQKRLQNYQREEVMRAYEAVQQACHNEEALIDTEIISTGM